MAMRMSPWSRTIIGAAAFVLGGCLTYNEPCQGLVDRADDVIGHLSADVFLDKPNARHANNAIGRIAAEAFIDAFRESDKPAQLGILNGGAIRAEGGVEGPGGQCITRNRLEAGPVTRGEIHQILFFDNVVYATELTEQELFDVMEHSVSGLSPVGTQITNPSGRFLQIAGGRLTVNCSLPAGARVETLEIGGVALERKGTRTFRVAMPEFLLRGGDGYAPLAIASQDTSRDLRQAQVEGGIDNRIVSAWMQRSYGDTTTAFQVESLPKMGCPAEAPDCAAPITLRECAEPADPS
jgi:5'-nucleotidase / UDP-sugar diphosphatase